MGVLGVTVIVGLILARGCLVLQQLGMLLPLLKRQLWALSKSGLHVCRMQRSAGIWVASSGGARWVYQGYNLKKQKDHKQAYLLKLMLMMMSQTFLAA